MSSLAGIFRRFWPGCRARFRQAIPAAHVRAAEAILRCRTPEAGMVYYRCGDCGKVEPHPVSCGHRACNACGRHLLRAGDIVLLLPDKAAITCPCCGQAMTFFHALRTRARPPPSSTRYGMALPA